MSMKNYPHNWLKVSLTLRRTIGKCELCHIEYPVRKLSVHHRGASYLDGRPGDPNDKHDLRRENLQVLCPWCHAFLDNMPSEQPEYVRVKRVERRHRAAMNKQAQRQVRVENHRALGVGTGLVPVEVFA